MTTKSLATLALLLSFGNGLAKASSDPRAPEVPSTLQVGAGYKVSFRAFALGVQIYNATVSPNDPTKLVWTLSGPDARLFDADGAVIGTHFPYAGPTRPGWQSTSGSLVVGTRKALPVTVDSNAIPWLLLDAVFAEGPGIFNRTVLIQRVNTTGGVAPELPPVQLGEEARIPYTAEYVFYRQE